MTSVLSTINPLYEKNQTLTRSIYTDIQRTFRDKNNSATSVVDEAEAYTLAFNDNLLEVRNGEIPTITANATSGRINASLVTVSADIATVASNDQNTATVGYIKNTTINPELLQSYATTSFVTENYLPKQTAQETYQPIGSYLTEAQADQKYARSGDYITRSEANGQFVECDDVDSIFASKLAPYLDSDTASATYQVKGDYVTTTTAAATYQIKGDYLTKAVADNYYEPLGGGSGGGSSGVADPMGASAFLSAYKPLNSATEFKELFGGELYGRTDKPITTGLKICTSQTELPNIAYAENIIKEVLDFSILFTFLGITETNMTDIIGHCESIEQVCPRIWEVITLNEQDFLETEHKSEFTLKRIKIYMPGETIYEDEPVANKAYSRPLYLLNFSVEFTSLARAKLNLYFYEKGTTGWNEEAINKYHYYVLSSAQPVIVDNVPLRTIARSSFVRKSDDTCIPDTVATEQQIEEAQNQEEPNGE